MTAKTVCSHTQCNIHVRSQCVNCSPARIRFAFSSASYIFTASNSNTNSSCFCWVRFSFIFFVCQPAKRLQVSAISFTKITTAKMCAVSIQTNSFGHLNFCILQFELIKCVHSNECQVMATRFICRSEISQLSFLFFYLWKSLNRVKSILPFIIIYSNEYLILSFWRSLQNVTNSIQNVLFMSQYMHPQYWYLLKLFTQAPDLLVSKLRRNYYQTCTSATQAWQGRTRTCATSRAHSPDAWHFYTL